MLCWGAEHEGIPNRDSGGSGNHHDCCDREREGVDNDGG